MIGILPRLHRWRGCFLTILLSIKIFRIGTYHLWSIWVICLGAHAFNQNLGDWNITSVSDLSSTFLNTHALSDSNKGEIHKTFASNPNWEYDWRPYVVIDDTNFQVAVNLWFDNQAEANATYGHISDWNTSAVTNMWAAFDGRSLFNEDISRWNVSNVKNLGTMFKSNFLQSTDW